MWRVFFYIRKTCIAGIKTIIFRAGKRHYLKLIHYNFDSYIVNTGGGYRPISLKTILQQGSPGHAPA